MASWTTAQSPCLITLKILSFMVFFLSRVSSLYTTLVTYPKVNMNGRYFSLQSSRPCIRQRSSGSPLRNGKSERRVHPNQKLRQREDPNGLTTQQTGGGGDIYTIVTFKASQYIGLPSPHPGTLH